LRLGLWSEEFYQRVSEQKMVDEALSNRYFWLQTRRW